MESDKDSPKLSFGSLDLTQFAYSPTTSPQRKSPRKSSIRPKEFASSPTRFIAEDEKPIKRALDSVQDDNGPSPSPSPQRSPKKAKRSYATPETYAHLRGLNDYLKDELDGTDQ